MSAVQCRSCKLTSDCPDEGDQAKSVRFAADVFGDDDDDDDDDEEEEDDDDDDDNAFFSRMRSEGFPFIVGVWLGSGVGPVFALFCCLVVVSSSPRRRQLVNSLPLGGTFALRHHPVFESMKSGGSLARNARFGAPKSQNVRSFSCFA